MKMVKMFAWIEFSTVFLKNRNFISKIRISKVTDYAALRNVFLRRFFCTPNSNVYYKKCWRLYILCLPLHKANYRYTEI